MLMSKDKLSAIPFAVMALPGTEVDVVKLLKTLPETSPQLPDMLLLDSKAMSETLNNEVQLADWLTTHSMELGGPSPAATARQTVEYLRLLPAAREKRENAVPALEIPSVLPPKPSMLPPGKTHKIY